MPHTGLSMLYSSKKHLYCLWYIRQHWVGEVLPPGHIQNTLCTFTSHCGNVLYVTSTTDLQPIKFCKQRV